MSNPAAVDLNPNDYNDVPQIYVEHAAGQFAGAGWGHGSMPQMVFPDDDRPTCEVLNDPSVMFYYPDYLTFPNMQAQEHSVGPPGNAFGGHVVYADQPMWDRMDCASAGPVRRFFHRLMHRTRATIQRNP